MGALGLTFGQVGINTTVYGPVREMVEPQPANRTVTYTPSYSTNQHRVSLGAGFPRLGFKLKVAASALPAFISDVTNALADRKIYYMIGTEEVYIMARDGVVTDVTLITKGGSVVRYYWVTCEFEAVETQVRDAATDAVLWGG
jgi:hypothetical protein